MPWARLDDNAVTNPKLLSISDTAWRLWASGLVYCADKLTDGFIPQCALSTFGVRGNLTRAVGELVNPWRDGAGALWSETGGGYQVRDYLQWNDSRADVIAERERKKRNMSVSRGRRVTGNADGNEPGTPPTTNHGPSPSPCNTSPSESATAQSAARSKKAESEKPLNSTNKLQRRYVELLAANTQVLDPLVNWEKVGSVFKSALAKYSEDVIAAALEKFMADRDPYLVEQAWQIGLFAPRFMRYASKAKALNAGAEAGEAAAEETKRKLKAQRDD